MTIHPTYTHPGVNAALLELSRSRARALRWKLVERKAQSVGLQHTEMWARRSIVTELHIQHGLLARLIRVAS